MYYKLVFETWSYEWENEDVFFFINKQDAELKQELLVSTCKTGNRSYILQISFEQLKEEITVADFEELFGLQINEPKSVDKN